MTGLSGKYGLHDVFQRWLEVTIDPRKSPAYKRLNCLAGWQRLT